MKVHFLAAAALCCAAAVAQAQTFLLPGDKAPEIKVAKYYQGEEIKSFVKGKVYVVEFWATWCGPCIKVIPHMSELSKKHAGKAEFIGVNIWDEKPGQDDRIRQFLKDMGSKMSYRVAVDTTEMYMTSKWMEASVSNGIPTAFIVNQKGDIAWIGHPTDIDEPLDQIINDKFDVLAARAQREKEVAAEVELTRLYEKLSATQALWDQGRKQEALKILDDMVAADELTKEAKALKLGLVAKSDPEGAKKIIDTYAKGEFADLANLAFFAIDSATNPTGSKPLAIYAADAVLDNMKRDDAILLYYIAPAYSVSKDHKKSLAVLERALAAYTKSEEYQKEMPEFRAEIENAIKTEKALINP